MTPLINRLKSDPINANIIKEDLEKITLNNNLQKAIEKKGDPTKENYNLNDPQEYIEFIASYWDRKGGGVEKEAFLAEVQQYMLDEKIIKHAYDKITVDHVAKICRCY